MQEKLKLLLKIQELDIKMIRLMRIKKQRQKELKQIESLRTELKDQLQLKQKEIEEIGIQVNAIEKKIQELIDKYKKFESQQALIKKVDEFNALTQQMTALEREKASLEAQASNILDKKVAEEEVLEKIKGSLADSETNSLQLEKEIKVSIDAINVEGRQLKDEREALAEQADPGLLKIYERLLRNKKDRVIVAIENRACSGCHIVLTLQHENLVRKGDTIVFCEHCSRIHYWQEIEAVQGALTQTRRRRRRIAQT